MLLWELKKAGEETNPLMEMMISEASAQVNIQAHKLLIVLEDYGCSLVCVHIAF